MNYPSAVQVAVAWLQSLGLAAGVGTELPANLTTWAEHGFVQVPTVVGGSPNRHVPMRNPVVQVDVWACRPDSEYAPWGKCRELAEQVMAAVYDYHPTPGSLLVMPAGYRSVFLHSLYALTEPREIGNDGAGFARLESDLALHWSLSSS